jgi:hypothetical protein
MQVAAPPVGTALREMFRGEESEGHCFCAASWLHDMKHLPNQKRIAAAQLHTSQ